MERPVSLCAECDADMFNGETFSKLLVADPSDLGSTNSGLWVRRSPATLAAGSARRCHVCQLLGATVASHAKDTLGSDQPIDFHLYFTPVEDATERESMYDVSLLFVEVEKYGCSRYNIFASQDDPAATCVTAREPDPVVDSPASFELVERWMSECLSSHKACLHPTGQLPTRVLDVAPDEAGVLLKLYQSQGEDAKYAALSYCWGVGQPTRTTIQCLEQYIQSIDPDSLPKTIQDAIKVTRMLGLRYLWVDSLCILQDRNEDKSREIHAMGQIYRNSQVCIVAAAAKTANDGFLARIAVPRPASFQLPYFYEGCRKGTIICRPWTSNNEYDPAEDPVAHRAWIFQERMLSQRLLIFPPAPHPLQWRCRTRRDSNGGSVAYDVISDLPSLPPDDHALAAIPKAVHLPPSPKAYGQWWMWTRLLVNFTARRLTESLDRLPAISAVAAEFQIVWGGEYFAGVWSHKMLQSLLWRLDPDGVPVAQDTTRYLAPSWSWAACNERVAIIFTHDDSLMYPFRFEIISCKVTPSNVDAPFGTVDSGTLTVRALVKPALWLATTRWKSELGDAREPARKVGIGTADEFYHSSYEEVWCMPITDASKHPNFADTGLVLARLEGWRFRRIGSLNVSAADWFDDCEPRVLEIV